MSRSSKKKVEHIKRGGNILFGVANAGVNPPVLGQAGANNQIVHSVVIHKPKYPGTFVRPMLRVSAVFHNQINGNVSAQNTGALEELFGYRLVHREADTNLSTLGGLIYNTVDPNNTKLYGSERDLLLSDQKPMSATRQLVPISATQAGVVNGYAYAYTLMLPMDSFNKTQTGRTMNDGESIELVLMRSNNHPEIVISVEWSVIAFHVVN